MSEPEPDGFDELVNMVMIEQWEAAQAGKLSMWTVYVCPADYPDGYIARRYETDKGTSTATEAKLATGPKPEDLHLLREIFAAAGLVSLVRHPDDDPTIVEVWM